MLPAGMSGLGRRLGSRHPQLASNLTSPPNLPLLPSGRTVLEDLSVLPVILPKPSMPPDLSNPGSSLLVSGRVFGRVPRPAPNLFPVSQEACGTLPKTALPSDLSTPGFSLPVSGIAFARVPRPPPNGGRRTDGPGAPTLVSQVGQKICTIAGDPSATNSGASTLVPQIKQKICTLAGDASATNPGGDDTDNYKRKLLKYLDDNELLEHGNPEQLHQWVRHHIDDMRTSEDEYKSFYNKYVRPPLASRCIIAPAGLSDPSTAFLYRQTFKILNHNASFMSCFDVTAYKFSCKDDDEWDKFLDHLVEKRIFVIEDWDSCISTVEILMHDHGLKPPDDGTDEPFYKGESDASYDEETQTASLSYIIWSDDKIVYAEVFKSIKCCSAVEAEIYASMALLRKAQEFKIRKLQVWSDSKTVVGILSGELSIGMLHRQREFFLTLRRMRSCFKWLVVSWKPRELMVFSDYLARAAKVADTNRCNLSHTVIKFFNRLRGCPVFRIERTKDATTIIKKIGKVILDESYGMSGNSVYFVDTGELSKFDCLRGLIHSLEPSMLKLFVGSRGELDLDLLTEQLTTDHNYDHNLVKSKLPNGGTVCTLVHKSFTSQSKTLVVVYDISVPADAYFSSGAFHVLLVTPTERQNISREEIPELSALGFVHFNEVRFPLNDDTARKQRKKKGEVKPEHGTPTDHVAQ